MNDFWLWFIRPIAEFFGGLALVFGAVLIFFIIVLIHASYCSISQWNRKRKQK